MVRHMADLENGDDVGKILEPLVDGKIVLGAYVVRLEEGIVAGWPAIYDDELVRIVEYLSTPLEKGLYIVVGGFF